MIENISTQGAIKELKNIIRLQKVELSNPGWEDSSAIAIDKDNNYYDYYRNELEFCYVRYLYATFIIRAVGFDKNEYQKALDLAIKNVHNNFPKYKKNKYFYRSFKGIYLVLFNKWLGNILYLLFHRKR